MKYIYPWFIFVYVNCVGCFKLRLLTFNLMRMKCQRRTKEEKNGHYRRPHMVRHEV